MFIISWTIDIRMNIQIWLLYRRYKSEWYNFWWATIQDIVACACKVWTLFGQACGQEECSQMTPMTTAMTMMTTDKLWLHRLVTDILSWAKNIKCALKESKFWTVDCISCVILLWEWFISLVLGFSVFICFYDYPSCLMCILHWVISCHCISFVFCWVT